jgi:hypothetical protein
MEVVRTDDAFIVEVTAAGMEHRSTRGTRLLCALHGSLGFAIVVLLALASAASARSAEQVTGSGGEDREPQVATDPGFRELVGGLLEGIPDFPVYPGATLVGSAERNRPDEQNRGYRIKWTTRDRPARVMAWYEKALPRHGWKYVRSYEPDEGDELEAKVAKGAFSGYLEAETEDDAPTVVVLVLERR